MRFPTLGPYLVNLLVRGTYNALTNHRSEVPPSWAEPDGKADDQRSAVRMDADGVLCRMLNRWIGSDACRVFPLGLSGDRWVAVEQVQSPFDVGHVRAPVST
ncbi:hypothetical protein GCM10023107_93430 [Actinoplanes octamycinicus]|nr:hypothetical protein Aoc01nite_23960 [Actinoplanes octamycinicus]